MASEGRVRSGYIYVSAQSKMFESPFDLQELQFEESAKDGKDMIVLSRRTAYGRFAQVGVLFERFAEDF